jgi:glycosyltransferase involved in cell wall biosynthesis
MRLLIISPLFPPVANAEAFCGGLFVNALRSAGIDVEVIMSSNALPHSGVDRSSCWQDLAPVVHDVPNPSRVDLATRARLSLRYQLPSWTAWTDAVVRAAAQLHRRSPFTAVMSRSLPSQAHYAGYWISRYLGIPWFANINDPLDFGPFVTDSAAKADWSASIGERLWHQRILRAADLITFPCERLRRHVVRSVQRPARNAVLPHVAIRGHASSSTGSFLIVHAGRIGTNELTSRSADAVLDGFAHLVQRYPDKRHVLKLRFVGPRDALLTDIVVSRGLQDVVEHTGAVSYEDSLTHISEAAACVLIEGPFREGVFLPSKLCNYLVARKPVLAFAPADGTVADLARGGGILHVPHGEPAAAAAAFEKLFDAFLGGRIHAYQPAANLADSFLPDVVADHFLQMVAERNALSGTQAGHATRPSTECSALRGELATDREQLIVKEQGR